MDRGTWCTTVHGVAKSQTWLSSRFNFWWHKSNNSHTKGLLRDSGHLSTGKGLFFAISARAKQSLIVESKHTYHTNTIHNIIHTQYTQHIHKPTHTAFILLLQVNFIITFDLKMHPGTGINTVRKWNYHVNDDHWNLPCLKKSLWPG